MERYDLRLHFLQALLARAQGRSHLHAGRTPSDRGVLYGPIGRTDFTFNYVTLKNDTRVELLIQTEDAKEHLRRLKQNKEAIEAAFGGALDWQEKAKTTQCRIFHKVRGGYCSPGAEWPLIHDDLIDAMIRLETALRPHMA